MGVSGVQRLVRFRGDRGRLNGRTNRTTDSGVLRLDVTASSSEISVLLVQDRIPNGSGIWCISGAVLVYDVRGILTGNRTRLIPHLIVWIIK